MTGIRQTPAAVAVYSLEWVLKALVVVFMLAPVILIVVLSFSNDSTLAFPPTSWGFDQYSNFLSSGDWTHAVWKSFEVAVPSSVLAVAVGVPAAIALERSRLPFKTALRVLAVAPLVLPGVAYAVALYAVYAKAHLIGSLWGVVVADAMISLPFVILIVGAGLRRIPADLELVAMTLGASRARATWGITVRLLAPSIAASALLGFVTNFDEAVFVNFLGGGEVTTLPKAIFDSFRNGINPLITAISTLLMVATGLLMFAATRLRVGESE